MDAFALRRWLVSVGIENGVRHDCIDDDFRGGVAPTGDLGTHVSESDSRDGDRCGSGRRSLAGASATFGSSPDPAVHGEPAGLGRPLESDRTGNMRQFERSLSTSGPSSGAGHQITDPDGSGTTTRNGIVETRTRKTGTQNNHAATTTITVTATATTTVTIQNAAATPTRIAAAIRAATASAGEAARATATSAAASAAARADTTGGPRKTGRSATHIGIPESRPPEKRQSNGKRSPAEGSRSESSEETLVQRGRERKNRRRRSSPESKRQSRSPTGPSARPQHRNRSSCERQGGQKQQRLQQQQQQQRLEQERAKSDDSVPGQTRAFRHLASRNEPPPPIPDGQNDQRLWPHVERQRRQSGAPTAGTESSRRVSQERTEGSRRSPSAGAENQRRTVGAYLSTGLGGSTNETTATSTAAATTTTSVYCRCGGPDGQCRCFNISPEPGRHSTSPTAAAAAAAAVGSTATFTAAVANAASHGFRYGNSDTAATTTMATATGGNCGGRQRGDGSSGSHCGGRGSSPFLFVSCGYHPSNWRPPITNQSGRPASHATSSASSHGRPDSGLLRSIGRRSDANSVCVPPSEPSAPPPPSAAAALPPEAQPTGTASDGRGLPAYRLPSSASAAANEVPARSFPVEPAVAPATTTARIRYGIVPQLVPPQQELTTKKEEKRAAGLATLFPDPLDPFGS